MQWISIHYLLLICGSTRCSLRLGVFRIWIYFSNIALHFLYCLISDIHIYHLSHWSCLFPASIIWKSKWILYLVLWKIEWHIIFEFFLNIIFIFSLKVLLFYCISIDWIIIIWVNIMHSDFIERGSASMIVVFLSDDLGRRARLIKGYWADRASQRLTFIWSHSDYPSNIVWSILKGAARCAAWAFSRPKKHWICYP